MMRKISLVLLSLALLLGGCNYLKNVRLLTGGSLADKNFTKAIPFEFRRDLIVVKVRLNADTTAREFIFDTGAFNSKVEAGLAEDLGLDAFASKTNTDSQGNERKIEVARLDSLSLGEVTFLNIGAGKLRYDSLSASPCVAAHGLIGANLIKLAHWKIDYANRLLWCSDSPFAPEEGQETARVPFSTPLLSGPPTLNLKVEEKEVSGILLDTGFNGGFSLPESVASAFGKDPEWEIYDASRSGIYGFGQDTLRIRKLSIGPGSWSHQLPVQFSGRGKGLLGNEYLQHFVLILDYDANAATLVRVPELDPKISDPLTFVPGVLNDSLWVVRRTVSGLPFALGDTILEVNGLRPVDLFEDHCAWSNGIGPLLRGDSLVVKDLRGDLQRLW